MHYFHWIAGTILALAWFSRIIEAAIGMPSVADISTPEWDRNPVVASDNPAIANPLVSIIVPARNEERDIEQSLTRLLELDYDNYEVIAVNDRSTDRTGEIMEDLAGKQKKDMGTPFLASFARSGIPRTPKAWTSTSNASDEFGNSSWDREGHDFSRAVRDRERRGLQPLGAYLRPDS